MTDADIRHAPGSLRRLVAEDADIGLVVFSDVRLPTSEALGQSLEGLEMVGRGVNLLMNRRITGELHDAGRQQRRVHEAALRALEAQGSDDAAALAQHAAGAREWAKLVTYTRVGAACQLREGAGLQALQLAELGLRLADELAVDDELALRSTAARAAWMTGAVDAANHHTDQWIRLAAHAGRPGAEAAAWRHQSLLWLHVDDRYRMAVDRARTIAEAL